MCCAFDIWQALPNHTASATPITQVGQGRCNIIFMVARITVKRAAALMDFVHRLDIIHDNISELKPALEENLRLHNDVTATLKFANSKQTPGIQIADFWCGNINIAVQNILSSIDTVPKEIIDILQRHVNFVGPYTEEVKLFPDNPQISLENKWFEDEFLS